MNCGSLFVYGRGGTMEASHPDTSEKADGRGSGKGNELAVNLLSRPIV